MYRPWILRLALCAAFAAPAAQAGQLAIVAHPESSIGALSVQEASHMFLGRGKALPSGERLVVVDAEPLRERFYRRLVGKGISEINAYWARLQFSGRTQAPLRMASREEAVARVLADRNALSYVEAEGIDARLKVVLRLEP